MQVPLACLSGHGGHKSAQVTQRGHKSAQVTQRGHKGSGKRGHIVADILLPTQMFPRLPACTTFVADTNFVSGTQKMFLILFRNIVCPQQMFPNLRSSRNIMGNNVSSFNRALRVLTVHKAAQVTQ